MRQELRTFAVVGAFLVGPLPPALAQEVIPAELARALVQGYGPLAGPVAFTVGVLPDGVPAEAVPPGAEVMGGIHSPTRTTAILHLQDGAADPRSVERMVAERLVAAGWEAHQPTLTVFGEGWTARPREPVWLCRDHRSLRLAAQRELDGVRLRVEVDGDAGAHRCARAGDLAAHLLVLPELSAPEDVRFHGSSHSRGERGLDARAQVRTARSIEAVIAHYADQFVAAGWNTVDRSASEGFAHHRFSLRAADGDEVTAIIAAVTVPGLGEQMLILRVERDAAAPLQQPQRPLETR
jgi:hypothetical protein